tara:strand:- start:125 stop:490 length:366 start_codon:yes stop_codon:yes gene_type:complete
MKKEKARSKADTDTCRTPLKLAICVFGHGAAMVWSIGSDKNIILATKAARKAKRDYKLKAWSVMPVNIFDITDSEKWAYDGCTIVNPDIVDKESESYKTDIYNPYRGAKTLPKIEVLEVVL